MVCLVTQAASLLLRTHAHSFSIRKEVNKVAPVHVSGYLYTCLGMVLELNVVQYVFWFVCVCTPVQTAANHLHCCTAFHYKCSSS